MKFIRLFSRLALLLLCGAAFAGLTEFYADSAPPPVPGPRWQMARQRRPSAPQLSRFPGFVGEGVGLALIAVAGRIVLRLRLSPASRGEEEPILLDLH